MDNLPFWLSLAALALAAFAAGLAFNALTEARYALKRTFPPMDFTRIGGEPALAPDGKPWLRYDEPDPETGYSMKDFQDEINRRWEAAEARVRELEGQKAASA